MSGKFDGLARVPPDEYAESYAKSREQNKEEIMLPELGDTVTVITKTGKQHEFEFLGFDYGTILTRVEKMGKTRTTKSNIGLIKNIKDSHGNVIAVEAVRKLISEGKIPLLSSGIIIKSKVGPTQINWENIYQIEVKKKGTPLATLALIAAGVAACVGIIYIAIKEIEKSAEEAAEEACAMGAAYDFPAHPYVIILQDFRDTYLMPCKIGRKLVNVYYKYSPFFAHFIAKHKALKIVVQINLLPIIAFSYSMLHLGPIVTAVVLIFIFALTIFIVLIFWRKFRQ